MRRHTAQSFAQSLAAALALIALAACGSDKDKSKFSKHESKDSRFSKGAKAQQSSSNLLFSSELNMSETGEASPKAADPPLTIGEFSVQVPVHMDLCCPCRDWFREARQVC